MHNVFKIPKKLVKRVLSKLYSIKRRIKRFKKKLLIRSKIKKIKKPTDESYLNTLKPIGELWILLFHLLKRGIKGKYILDVGAHSTEWSRLAMKVFPNAQIYLIEPLEEMELHLKKFCIDFPGSKYFLNGAGAKFLYKI